MTQEAQVINERFFSLLYNLFSLLLMYRDRRNYDRARGMRQFWGKGDEGLRTMKALKQEGMDDIYYEHPLIPP